MKTLLGAKLDDGQVRDCQIKVDAKRLPEDIKDKAREYVAKRRPRFRTFGIVSDDVEDAWLEGFAFCLQGQVEVKIKDLQSKGDWVVPDKEPL